MVYQENFIGRYNIPPLQLIGWEGIFGFVSLSLLLIPVSEKKATKELLKKSLFFFLLV